MKNANPVSHRVPVLLAALFALTACGREGRGEAGDVPASPAASQAPVRYTYEVVGSWPHDPAAFTEGLVFHDGDLLESTGLNGESSLRDVDLKTGQVVKQVTVDSEYFGEGLAVIGPLAFQLTWRSQKGFIYDAATFRKLGEFSYEGEGWGMTTDGKNLIVSDGSSRIKFIDPATFRVIRTIEVIGKGRPVDQINELEWVKGEIFANVWQTDEILRIDPATGAVRGVVDLTGLLPAGERGPNTDVLNGIAYDDAHDRLYVTGKRWPKVFEVRLKRIAGPGP